MNPNSTEVAIWVWNLTVSVSYWLYCPVQDWITSIKLARAQWLYSLTHCFQPCLKRPSQVLALPFSCLFHFWESFPNGFLEAARSCQCHHFLIHQSTLSSKSIAQKYMQKRETLAWSLQAFAAKAEIRLPLYQLWWTRLLLSPHLLPLLRAWIANYHHK